MTSIKQSLEKITKKDQFRKRIGVIATSPVCVLSGLQAKEDSSSSDTDSDVDGVDIDHDEESVDGEPIKTKADLDGVPMTIPQPKPKREF